MSERKPPNPNIDAGLFQSVHAADVMKPEGADEEVFEPPLSEITPTDTAPEALKTQREQHILELEAFADECGRRWWLVMQVKMIDELINFAWKDDDPAKRLPFYHAKLKAVYQRLGKFGKQMDEKEKLKWERLRGRALLMLIDLSQIMMPSAKKTTSTKKTGKQPESLAQQLANRLRPPPPPKPKPKAVDYSKMTDEELAQHVPEGKR